MAKSKNKIFSKKIRISIAAILFLITALYFSRATVKSLLGKALSYYSAFCHDYEDTNYTFGIDVSHYQQKINWSKVAVSKHPIRFTFIRATMGGNRKDKTFKYNWRKSKKNGIIRGAYHYYDPNENSTLQAENFISRVKLKKGDLPPVLDIEIVSKFGTSNLQQGLKNWLNIIEKHYGVKPIIYTGYSYYLTYLKSNFSNYPVWIAAYSRSKKRISKADWKFHQFTDKVKVSGIIKRVDGNDYNGSYDDLIEFTLKRTSKN